MADKKAPAPVVTFAPVPFKGTSFVAAAIKAATGDKAAALNAAALAVARGVYLVTKDGNLPPLQEAREAVAAIGDKKAAARIVAAAFVAALASAAAIVGVNPASGKLVDMRKGEAKRGGKEAAEAAEAAAYQAFNIAAEAAARAEAAKAEAKKAEAEAKKAEAAAEAAEAEAAPAEVPQVNPAEAAILTLVKLTNEAAAPLDFLATMLERCPASVTLFAEAAALALSRRAEAAALAMGEAEALEKGKAEAAALNMAQIEAAALAADMKAAEAKAEAAPVAVVKTSRKGKKAPV